ncbi:MAG: hypothetical protein HYV09_36915 [Deltaproteobacteria bacterium]|nr:hypothetical protein [Deltaproteobacteria bacterium]
MRRLLFAAALLFGCLPVDTRPPPAEVLVTLRGAPSTIDGVTTADGWAIRFDRVVVTVGGSDLEGDGCDEYADAGYFRILDGRVAAPQKVGLMFGLGDCTFEMRARNPEFDTLLGQGVTEEDKTRMRTPGSDPFESNVGITFVVRGSAERAGVRKTFDWSFRNNRVSYDGCVIDGQKTFALSQNAPTTIDLQVHAEALFHDRLDPDEATVRFDPIAAADDGDGVVTLEELTEVPLADAAVTFDVDAETKDWKTLGDFVYRGLFPRIVRPGDRGTCTMATTRRGGGPMH